MREATQVHTRLLRSNLAVQESRAFWRSCDGTQPAVASEVFEACWFGAKSLHRVKVLLADLRARYQRFPQALAVLHGWPDMTPGTRRLLCHWHLQVADPLYRRFSGGYLLAVRASDQPTLGRRQVVEWLGAHWSRWGLATRIQFASKLLSTCHGAGLLGSKRDPRPVLMPRVEDAALEYLLYFLRRLRFEGSLLDNPYLASVGLAGGALQARLRALPGLDFRSQGGLADFGWRYEGLQAWSRARGATIPAGGRR